MHYLKKYFAKPPKWCRWDDRDDLSDLEQLGVYVIAVSANRPTRRNPAAKDVVYIGEAHGDKSSLKQRMRYFGRAARGKNCPHSGGTTFLGTIGPLDPVKAWTMIFPTTKRFPGKKGAVLAKLIERELIWEYYRKHGCLPKCNKE